MSELRFSPEANQQLDDLEGADVSCAGRLHRALDRLENDPGAAVNRRRRFQGLDAWGIDVRCGDDDWLIIWSYLARSPDVVVIEHIVPAP